MNEKLRDLYSQINRLYAAKAFSELETYLLDKLDEEMVTDGTDSILISILNELATFYRGQNEPEKSIEYLQMAADVTQNLIGRNSREYATLIMNLSAAHRINKNGRVAVELADTAAEILKELGEQHRYFYCAAINNKGMAYLSLYEPAKARECFKEAIEILIACGLGDDPDTEEICVTMINIAFTYYEEKEFENAENFCQTILKRYEQINKDKWSHLYALYTLMGDIYKGLNRKEDAVNSYQTAMKLVEEDSGQNFEYKNIKEKLEAIVK